MLYTLIVNGKSRQIEGVSAESIVRSAMCWYGFNTLFTVIDKCGKTNKYRKIKTNNSIAGYADLKEEIIQCGFSA